MLNTVNVKTVLQYMHVMFIGSSYIKWKAVKTYCFLLSSREPISARKGKVLRSFIFVLQSDFNNLGNSLTVNICSVTVFLNTLNGSFFFHLLYNDDPNKKRVIWINCAKSCAKMVKLLATVN